MSESNSSSVSVMVCFSALVLLTLPFVCLKLTGAISWSWWLVLGPLWFPYAFVLGFGAFFIAIASVLFAIAGAFRK